MNNSVGKIFFSKFFMGDLLSIRFSNNSIAVLPLLFMKIMNREAAKETLK
jgi:hypothetical protein